MKITLESTSHIVNLINGGLPVPARIWEGTTESGIPVHCYITRIAAPASYDQNEFLRGLQELLRRAPGAEGIRRTDRDPEVSRDPGRPDSEASVHRRALPSRAPR